MTLTLRLFLGWEPSYKGRQVVGPLIGYATCRVGMGIAEWLSIKSLCSILRP